jgi:hypothetical protein
LACPHHAEPRDRAGWLVSCSLVHRRLSAAGAVLCPRRQCGRSVWRAARLVVAPTAGASLRACHSQGGALGLEGSLTEKALRWEISRDGGRQWSEPRTVAESVDASHHPLLIARGPQVFLSWLTKNEGYRLIAIG